MDTPLDLNNIHILLVVEKSANDGAKWTEFHKYALIGGNGWLQAKTGAHGVAQYSISDNVWLFSLKDGLPWLGRLAAGAEYAGLAYKYLVFPSAPAWVSVGDKSRLANSGGGSIT